MSTQVDSSAACAAAGPSTSTGPAAQPKSIPTTDAGHTHLSPVSKALFGADSGNLGYPLDISAILANGSIPGFIYQIIEFLNTKPNGVTEIVEAI